MFIISIVGSNLSVGAVNMDNDSFYELMIYENDTVEDIAKELKNASIIRNEKIFITYGKLFGESNNIQLGLHKITTDMKLKDIFQELNTYRQLDREIVKVTIPEGFNVEQIAKRLSKNRVIRENDFLATVNNEKFDYWFLEDTPNIKDKDYYKLEGFLFPATYEFYTDSNPKEVINTMLKRFDLAISPYRDEINKSKYSVFDIIRMASVVERESKLQDEMPIIAGVFYNRLDTGMKLQSCATVQYLFEEQKPVITYEDLEIDSPYNTYQNTGLPIGAISNPGDNAIKASIYPQANNYLYFVAIGSTGQHKFAETFAQHEENIRKYRD